MPNTIRSRWGRFQFPDKRELPVDDIEVSRTNQGSVEISIPCRQNEPSPSAGMVSHNILQEICLELNVATAWLIVDQISEQLRGEVSLYEMWANSTGTGASLFCAKEPKDPLIQKLLESEGWSLDHTFHAADYEAARKYLVDWIRSDCGHAEPVEWKGLCDLGT